jgi:catechol 2,3-dioxygenase-like lactoylglutathione lyase family enzyme
MTVLRMDNVGIVVDDLAAATAFFIALGLTRAGGTTVEGPWVDQVVGLAGVRSEVVMMRTPDGLSQLELTKYHSPPAIRGAERNPPANTIGLLRVMFAVTDIDATLARLQAYGAEIVGEVAQYEDQYRLCYVRGPEGIVVALAEPLG